MEKIQKEDNMNVEDIVQKAYNNRFQNILDEPHWRTSYVSKIIDIHTKTEIKAQTNETAKEAVMKLLGGREFPAVDKIYSVLQDKPLFDRADANSIYDMFFNHSLKKLSPKEFSRDYDETLGSWGTERVGYSICKKSNDDNHYHLNLVLLNKCFEKEHIIQFKDDDELRYLDNQRRSLQKSYCDPELDFEEREAFNDKKHDDLRRIVSCEIGPIATKKAYAKTKELTKEDLNKLQKYLGHMPDKGKVQQYFKEQLLAVNFKKQCLEVNTGAIPIAEEILGIKADYNLLLPDIYDKLVDNVGDGEIRNLLEKIVEFTGIPAKFNEDKIQEIYKNNLTNFGETRYQLGLFGGSWRGIHYHGGEIIGTVKKVTKIQPKFSNTELENVQELLFDEKNIDLLESGNGIISTIKQMKEMGGKEPEENIAQIAYRGILANNPKQVYGLEKIISTKPIFNKSEIDEAILKQLREMPQSDIASNESSKYLDNLSEIADITKRDMDLKNPENFQFRKPVSRTLIQTYKQNLSQERKGIEKVFTMTENDRYTLIQEGLAYDLLEGYKYDGSYITPDIDGVEAVLQKEGIKPEKATLTKFANKCFNVESYYKGSRYIEAVKKLKDINESPIEVDDKIAKGYIEYHLERGDFDAIKDLEYVTGKEMQFK